MEKNRRIRPVTSHGAPFFFFTFWVFFRLLAQHQKRLEETKIEKKNGEPERSWKNVGTDKERIEFFFLRFFFFFNFSLKKRVSFSEGKRNKNKIKCAPSRANGRHCAAVPFFFFSLFFSFTSQKKKEKNESSFRFGARPLHSIRFLFLFLFFLFLFFVDRPRGGPFLNVEKKAKKLPKKNRKKLETKPVEEELRSLPGFFFTEFFFLYFVSFSSSKSKSLDQQKETSQELNQ